MTLQQLRYLVAIAEYGSINAAATNMFASQSNLSTAVRDLEREFGINIFTRSNRGVTPTNEGTELLAYARQVLEQADMLESRYANGHNAQRRLAISTQHYSFSVEAFIKTAEDCGDSDEYDFILRETATGEIISDVANFRSEIGILYTDSFNERVLSRTFADANLSFNPLFTAKAHVFVGENHPLASKKVIEPEELEEWPRYSFEQGTENSFYHSEEPLSHLPHKRIIRISDRGTLTNLLTSFDGYTISTGVLSPEMLSGIASIPLNSDVVMRVGYLIHRERKPSSLLLSYIGNLHEIIKNNPTVNGYLGD